MAQAAHKTSTSRRKFIATAAVAAVVAPSATASTIDPIYTLIDRHRLAFRKFCELSNTVDKVAAKLAGGTVTEAAIAKFQNVSEQELEACEALIEAVPVALAGMAAAVRWLAEYDEGCMPDMSGRFLRSLAKSPVLIGV
ncbi:MAG: hypothetical protein J0G95_10800 [Rhizobiales bacterium]|nr:hypothetical protein [Hyphomicrobiales bacterium]